MHFVVLHAQRSPATDDDGGAACGRIEKGDATAVDVVVIIGALLLRLVISGGSINARGNKEGGPIV